MTWRLNRTAVTATPAASALTGVKPLAPPDHPAALRCTGLRTATATTQSRSTTETLACRARQSDAIAPAIARSLVPSRVSWSSSSPSARTSHQRSLPSKHFTTAAERVPTSRASCSPISWGITHPVPPDPTQGKSALGTSPSRIVERALSCGSVWHLRAWRALGVPGVPTRSCTTGCS